jgi:two-component system response regulator FixJ
MTPANRVFIIDDDSAVRDAVATLVESVGLHANCFADADTFLAEYRGGTPGCLISDVCLPGTDGVQLQRILKERRIEIPLIVISAHGDIPMAVEMVRRGAIDFIEKPFRNHVLLERIHEALEKAERRHREYMADAQQRAHLASLTPREKEVLPLLIDGHANKIIARELSLSPRTVETHRANILRKMHADSVTSLARVLTPDLWQG